MSTDHLSWWNNLRHSGLFLDLQRLTYLFRDGLPIIPEAFQQRLRIELNRFYDDPDGNRNKFVSFFLECICGLDTVSGQWYRESNVATAWTRHNSIGEAIRPNQLWISNKSGTLPVFIDSAKRLGIGHGRRSISRTLQWLRKSDQHLALVTNGRQWRILFAGMDYEAWCEWDIEQWFSEGRASSELLGLKGLLSPLIWTSLDAKQLCPLESAINQARKGQADLSQILGERVRQAVEVLIQAHSPELNDDALNINPKDIYRAAVRIIMRIVVVLFAESREGLLPVDHPVYQGAYSLGSLRDQLSRISPHRLENSYYAYPRLLALFRLLYNGSSHEAFTVPEYRGTLFAPGDDSSDDSMLRGINLFENACFKADLVNDLQIKQILDLLTRTRIKLRQGRSNISVNAPVDFSSLGSEYIGILYEGLLDFELRCAPDNEPVVFLSVGDNPALPLTALESMNDQAIKGLLEKLKDTSSDTSESDEDLLEIEDSDEIEENIEDSFNEQDDDSSETDQEIESIEDARLSLQGRAEAWARNACEIGRLVTRPSGKMTTEKQIRYERNLDATARNLISKVVLPGEWYLVRWGGTRKGAGTFYTKPQLAIPTVHRTLFPLAYDPPTDSKGNSNKEAPLNMWIPKKPENILSLKICDPACGSGTFPLAALRFLTDALYESLILHDRVREYAEKSILALICDVDDEPVLSHEDLPCRPDDDDFEIQTKAVLRRYIVERCIYGVDLDPLAVELCRLSLWIETIDKNLPMTFLKHKIKCGNSLVGAWFDAFLHYPAMAWNREGGDKNHTNGVHYEQNQWTSEIKGFLDVTKAELKRFIDGGQLFQPIDLDNIINNHDVAEKALRDIHDIQIAQVQQREEEYESLINSDEFIGLKSAFDLWCALWFWPGDKITCAPNPFIFYNNSLSDALKDIVNKLALDLRFFHWELEFPDVFNADSGGFDAVLGNPPWDITKPNSKEFFSAIDPLYRGYGKQEAIRKQKKYFTQDKQIEQNWLTYNSFFKSMANWSKFAGHPFGDRITYDSNGRAKHDLPLGDRGRSSFDTSEQRHQLWRNKRLELKGYADEYHPFCHQGGGDINLYKMFLEQANCLLRNYGRFGLIVPSGIYSDHGTGALRTLFIEHCKWEWLFGFENREGIFDIHRSYKFNPVIIEKGARTENIKTAFMHRHLSDWEDAEHHLIEYPKANVLKFSPHSKALLEIQSKRDLEILEKIYSNSVLLGDKSSEGWGIQYATEFHMTNDSKLFPPRPKWEEWGYQPDEYSRWVKGPWQPVEALYAELGISPPKEGEKRCAQPPYDSLSIPRADIPEGIILSRDATQFIKETEIPEVTFTDASNNPLKIKFGRGRKAEEIEISGPAIALPLYEGRMIGQFDFSEKGWVSGSGRSAEWKNIPWGEKIIEPQFLMSKEYLETSYLIPYLIDVFNIKELSEYQDVLNNKMRIAKILLPLNTKNAFMDVGSATNSRSMVSSLIGKFPSGNKTPLLKLPETSLCGSSLSKLCGQLNSFIFDFALRNRLVGLTLNYFIVSETPIVNKASLFLNYLASSVYSLTCGHPCMSVWWVFSHNMDSNSWKTEWALKNQERVRQRCVLDSISALLFGLDFTDLKWLFSDCDFPVVFYSKSGDHSLNPKGFWRIDKEKNPEHRRTVLSLIAFHDLQQKIDECDGNVENGIENFMNQNNGEGWMLPEVLRLADYGLGHDERAKDYQPVRETFGPRFFDWQLAQDREESWRECNLHARNLLGAQGYKGLIDGINNDSENGIYKAPLETKKTGKVKERPKQYKLFN